MTIGSCFRCYYFVGFFFVCFFLFFVINNIPCCVAVLEDLDMTISPPLDSEEMANHIEQITSSGEDADIEGDVSSE